MTAKEGGPRPRMVLRCVLVGTLLGMLFSGIVALLAALGGGYGSSKPPDIVATLITPPIGGAVTGLVLGLLDRQLSKLPARKPKGSANRRTLAGGAFYFVLGTVIASGGGAALPLALLIGAVVGSAMGALSRVGFRRAERRYEDENKNP